MASEHYDPPKIVEPFEIGPRTYAIMEYHDNGPWLFWRHPDGQWVTVCSVEVNRRTDPVGSEVVEGAVRLVSEWDQYHDGASNMTHVRQAVEDLRAALRSTSTGGGE